MRFREPDRAVRSSHPLARATAFAATAVTVSLVGTSPPAELPRGEATVLLALVLTGVGYRMLLAGRERSWPALETARALTECALHLLFMHGAAVPRLPRGRAASAPAAWTRCRG